MKDKKPKHNLSSYFYEHNWKFMTDLIDSFKGSGHSEKEWSRILNKSEHDRKMKKYWR